MDLDHSKEPLYQNQDFLKRLPKLSNKGWQTHLRVVKLDKNSLSYYNKIPKNFVEDNCKFYLVFPYVFISVESVDVLKPK